MKKRFKFLTVLISVLLFINSSGCDLLGRNTSTTDASDYGNFTGNSDNATVEKYINSFFPKELEDNFEDVTYSYQTTDGFFAAYAYEAYLEFTISELAEYEAFVNQHTKGLESKSFLYDDSFVEYTIDDEIYFESSYSPVPNVTSLYSKYTDSWSIWSAKIGKILCNDAEQRIIFVAIGVSDDGGADLNKLNVFFTRFNITPWQYAKPQSVNTAYTFYKTFFPASIESDFDNVMSSYRTGKGDSYSYEAYLEFTIKDPTDYAECVEQYTREWEAQECAFDSAFKEYVIADEFYTNIAGGGQLHIQHAQIGKILQNDAEQRLIFVAFGAHNVAEQDVADLDVFLTRFGINLRYYAE